MATLTPVVSASTAANGPLFTVSWSAAWNFISGFTSPADQATALESVLNQAFVQADANAPEGALLQLDLSGWPTIPLIGNPGPSVANQINAQWQAGNVVYPSGPEAGLPYQAWPSQYWSGAFATYDAATNTVTVRAVKAQGILTIILVILGILVALAVINWILGQSGLAIQFKGFVPTIGPAPAPPTPGSVASWWDNLSLLDKLLLGGGALGLAGFGLYVYGEERIHKAGAAHSSINIINEPP